MGGKILPKKPSDLKVNLTKLIYKSQYYFCILPATMWNLKFTKHTTYNSIKKYELLINLTKDVQDPYARKYNKMERYAVFMNQKTQYL